MENRINPLRRGHYDKLCLFCFAVLLVAGLGIDVGIGLNGEPDQPPA